MGRYDLKNLMEMCIEDGKNIRELTFYLRTNDIRNSDLIYLVDNLDSINFKGVDKADLRRFFTGILKNTEPFMKLDLFEKVMELYDEGKISKDTTLDVLGSELSLRKNNSTFPFLMMETILDKYEIFGEFKNFKDDEIFELFEVRGLTTKENIVDYLIREESSYYETFHNNFHEKEPNISFSVFMKEKQIEGILKNESIVGDELRSFISNLDLNLATTRGLNGFIYAFKNQNMERVSEVLDLVIDSNPNLLASVTAYYFTPEQIDKAINLENPMVAKDVINGGSFKSLDEDKQKEYALQILEYSLNDENWNKYPFNNDLEFVNVCRSNLASKLAEILDVNIDFNINGKQELVALKEVMDSSDDFSK